MEMEQEILAGTLSQQTMDAIRKLDGTWHTFPTLGSQSTSRTVSLSYWKSPDGEKERMYIRLRIQGRTPRDGSLGYIDLKTGAVVPDRSTRQEIATALDSIAQGKATWWR